MVDSLCSNMNSLSFKEANKELCNSMSNLTINPKKIGVSIRNIDTKSKGLIYRLLDNISHLPKPKPHIIRSTQRDKEILQKRIDRERRKLARLKQPISNQTKAEEKDPHFEFQKENEQNENTSEKENEDIGAYTEVYEDSHILEDEDGFDVDEFNDE